MFDVITPIQMGRGSIPLSVGIFHTVLASTRDLLKDMDISNNSSSSGVVTVYLVPDGDSPGAANILIPAITIPGNGIFQWSGIQVLNEGDTIQAVATATGVSINMSGGSAT